MACYTLRLSSRCASWETSH